MAIKRVIFRDHDYNHAALINKLSSLKVSQNDFFQFFVEVFLSEDVVLDRFVEKLMINKSRLGSRPRSKLEKQVKTGREVGSKLGLTHSERDDIFDILEKENFDD